MADRLAGEGYAVLTVNPFYRWQKSPVVDAANDWCNPAVGEKLFGYLKQLAKPVVETDARAHLAFLDAQGEVDTKSKIGTSGYCMGGPMESGRATWRERVCQYVLLSGVAVTLKEKKSKS